MSRIDDLLATGRSPWTDPRALGLSLLIHVLVLAIGSLIVLGIKLPRSPEQIAFLTAEVGPVDNRAQPEIGGGAPGISGHALPSAIVRLEANHDDSNTPREGSAEALLTGVLPERQVRNIRETGPTGPSTMGPGLIPGMGASGGGGSGGGAGGGVGPGIGPGTEFFGTPERALSFAFVIDYSGSMSHRNALKIAKAELLKSLERLPPDARFGVVMYNVEPTIFRDSQGEARLMAATLENKERTRERLLAIRPEGGTDHAKALRAAIAMKPEVIYFLTDAETMDPDVATAIQAEAGPIRIQAIEFGDGPSASGSQAIRSLAAATGGLFGMSIFRGSTTRGDKRVCGMFVAESLDPFPADRGRV